MKSAAHVVPGAVAEPIESDESIATVVALAKLVPKMETEETSGATK
jgi:hypothetical protein